jgi:hypothetical protein
MGFSADASLFEFPLNMFLPGSDLTSIEKNIDKIIYGLTRWEPKKNGNAAVQSKTVAIEGRDYVDAINKMNTLFLKKSWGDGLPLMPATEESVDWLLTGTDLPRDTVIGRIMPSGRTATVETLAISLVMTRGRPEYLPVLIGAMQAFTDPRFQHQMMQATTCSVSVAGIVNGSIGKQVRLNSGYGCIGPDPLHPAGGCIGRALRLIQQNVGQALPGSGSMSIFGGPLKYTNVIFAEDEEGLPQGWDPLSVEKGFSKTSNVITIHAVASATNITSTDAGDEQQVMETLSQIARVMGSDYGNIFNSYYENSAPGVLILPRGVAQGIVAAGWSKSTIKEFLWQNTKFPWSVVSSDSHLLRRTKGKMLQLVSEGQPWPISMKSENLMIVVAGGKQSGHSYWMRMGCCPLQPVSAEIMLPKNWDSLISSAEDDLGPLLPE